MWAATKNGCLTVLITALGAVLSASASAAPASAEAPAVAAAERVRAVLEAHCPECRTRRGSGGALDLAALAADLRLVIPRRPDESRAYQRLLAAQGIALGKDMKDEAPSGDAGPSSADIEAVRDWIESLPPRDAGCRDRALLSNADVEALIDRWVAAVGTTDAADTRFISLAHLWNACADPARLAADRAATQVLLAAIARRSEPLEIETLGDENALLAVRLSALSVAPADWDRLRHQAPGGSDAEAIPADWLAAHLLKNADERTGQSDPAFPVRFDGVGQHAVEGLARSWNDDVDLVRASAERGIAPRDLAVKLAALDEDHIRAAMRLMHASLDRDGWDNLSRVLDGETRPPTPWKRETAEGEIDLLLWTDQPIYRPQDLATVKLTVSRACHLTLISIDRDGRAIVLFPNELEQDNLVPPGVIITVPGRDAGYQFRFERAGEEKMVAVCERASRRLEGVSYDYERQRFASLGDWRTFLRTVPEREKEIVTAEKSQADRRKRRGRPAPAIAPEPIDATDAASGRAAITVTIARAPGP